MKNCVKGTLNSKGSITIAAAIILSCVILFNTVLYDYLTTKAIISCLPEKMSLACNSVLAGYDALLADKYGLYGYNAGSGDSVHKDFIYYFGNVDCDVKLKDDFTKPEIMKEQICDMMKFKTPVSVTETVLEALDVISKSDKNCDDHNICGKAAQKLSELQGLHDDLKLKVEGYFSKDPICVNGFTQGVAVEMVTGFIKADNESFDKLICQVIALHKQYMEYNNEAAVLCNQLSSGVDEIHRILSQLDTSTDETSDFDTASSIKKQAMTLLNSAAFEKINHNCEVFKERITALESIKEKDFTNITEIKSVVEMGNIYTDIHINTLYVGDNQGLGDNRKNLADDIKDKVEASSTNTDTYVIPSMEYADFVSVKAKKFTENYCQLIDPNVDGFMDNFESFDTIFSFWKNVSFDGLIDRATESIMIDDYIITYMTSRLSGVSDDKIYNEIEYILGGNDSCSDNNDIVEQKIIALRFVLNFVNIMRSKEKTALAETMASAIAFLVSGGAGVTLYKYIIISSWALIDSYNDLDSLLKGQSVPIVELGENEAINELQDYDFYLRLLLLITDTNTKLLRICDMIEINMKEITGEKYKLSGVYNTISVKIFTEFKFISPVMLGIKDVYKREDFYEVSY